MVNCSPAFVLDGFRALLNIAPALKLPVFRHDIEMAMPSYLASLNSPLSTRRSAGTITSHILTNGFSSNAPLSTACEFAASPGLRKFDLAVHHVVEIGPFRR